MIRGTWVFRDGKLVPKHEAAPLRGPASDLPCPMLQRDHMEPVKGMHDGKTYDSKSALRASYRNGPVKYVEYGNDVPMTPRDNRKPLTKAEIAAALDKVKNGYKPAPLETSVIPDDAA